jgi:hypothetical protein
MRCLQRLFFLLFLILTGLGCAQASPRFGPDVQTALAREEMRRMETDDIRLYYAQRDHDTAVRMLSRFEGCVAELRRHAKVKNRASREKLVVVVPRLPFNNAYVKPAAMGQEHVAVVPAVNTNDVFSIIGLPPDPSTIGCHEMVHYIQARQLSGIPNGLEAVFGYLFSPELGLESWFWEGLAVYYETKLQKGTGRLASSFWNGTFAAGVADEGLREADMNDATRRIPFSGSYLVGSHFIDWLAETFGEQKLWNVVERQSDEIAFPLGVSGRFTNAFGRPLARLYADFVRDAKKRHPKRPRPAGEREVRLLDQSARYAIARDGTEAIFEQGVDTPARLRVFAPSGELLVDRNLTGMLPGRDLVQPSAMSSSGISFTSDCKHLYWTALDVGYTFQVSRLVRLDLETEKLTVVSDDIGGAGGSVAPDGSGYFFSRARGDRWELARFDFATGTSQGIAEYGPQTYVVGPRVSPDGTKIALTLGTKDGMDVRIVDAKAGTVFAGVAGPAGWHTEPAWASDDELLYIGEAEGRPQVFRARLSAKQFERLSDAPHVAFAPHMKGDRVRFLSRVGWKWAVDEIDATLLPAPSTTIEPPSHAVAIATTPPEPRIDVASDEPYAQTDGLFIPTLRGPSVAATSITSVAGMGLSGGDRLGFHRWAIEGIWDFAAQEPSASGRYLNGQLAPVMIGLAGERVASKTNVLFETPTGDEERSFIRRETAGALAVARRFWTTTVTTSFRFDQLESARGVLQPTAPSPNGVPVLLPTERRHAGPQLGVTYAAMESTSAAGVRRALTIEASSAFFPALSTPATGDVRLAVGVVRPLPLSERHTLILKARGRALPSTKPDAASLQVGGSVASAALATEVADGNVVDDIPLTLRFHEPLRGFEDLGLLGNRAILGDVTYRLPLVLDVGSISTISILPSLLFRQIDFEAFGSGASLLDGRLAAAAGGAVIARFKLWVVPFGLGIQVARRLTQDEGFNVMFAGGG